MMAEHLLPRQPGRHKPLWSRWVVILSCVICLASYNSSGDSGTPPTDPLQTLIVTIAEPIALAVEADGSLAVVDGVLDAVVRVHPTTGHHTLVSGLGRGTGSFVGFPAGIAVAPDGALMVTYNGVEAGAVVRVDPITGDRTVLSGCAAVDDSFKCTSLIGAGHPLDFPRDIAVESNGDLVDYFVNT
jgi:streptogramin lyase